MTDSIYNTFTNFDTCIWSDRWDDVKSYTAVIQTLKGPLNGQIVLNWGTGSGDNIPNGPEDIIAVDQYNISLATGESLSRQYDIRTRWLSVSGDFSNSQEGISKVTTMYKRVPTDIKLCDNSDIASIYRHETDPDILISDTNSLKIGLTGKTGTIVNSTLHDTAITANLNSLYVHLSDSSAKSLDTTLNNTICVGLIDSSNVRLESAGVPGKIIMEDPTLFPSTDLVIMVDRSYSMNTDDIDGQVRYRVVYNTILPEIVNYLNAKNAFAVDGRTRVTLLSYARQEASLDISTGDLNTDIAHDSQRHDELESYFGAGIDGEFKFKPYRTIIPGAIEADSTRYDDLMLLLQDVSNILLADDDKAGVTGSALCDAIFDVSTGVSHHHHQTDDISGALLSAYYTGSLDYGSGRYPAAPHLHPATHPYAVIDRFIDGSGVGNKSRLKYILTGSETPLISDTDKYDNIFRSSSVDTSVYNYTTNRRRILINLTDGNINDDPVFSYDGNGILDETGNYKYVKIEDRGAPKDVDETDMANRIYNSAQSKLSNVFGDNIYVFNINNEISSTSKDVTLRFVYGNTINGVEISGSSQLQREIWYADASANNRITAFGSTGSRTVANIKTALGSMLDNIFDITFVGHNVVGAALTDSSGNLQAGTSAVKNPLFEGNALYYSLADGVGNRITTVDTSLDFGTAPVALYVHATDNNGNSIAPGNELQIKYTTRTNDIIYPFDLDISGALTAVTTPDLRDTSFKLHRIGIGNDMPTTMWLKVYDISTGRSSDSVSDISDSIIYNIPVPGESYRDIKLGNGVLFANGMYLRISDDFPLDAEIGSFGTGVLHIDGNYS